MGYSASANAIDRYNMALELSRRATTVLQRERQLRERNTHPTRHNKPTGAYKMNREDILKSTSDLSPKQEARHFADCIAAVWDTIIDQQSEIIELRKALINYQEETIYLQNLLTDYEYQEATR